MGDVCPAAVDAGERLDGAGRGREGGAVAQSSHTAAPTSGALGGGRGQLPAMCVGGGTKRRPTTPVLTHPELRGLCHPVLLCSVICPTKK